MSERRFTRILDQRGLERFTEKTIDNPSALRDELERVRELGYALDDEEHAIRLANDTPYGLAAYVQTGCVQRARRLASRLRAGAVHINGGAYQYGSPFGGYKQSGNGREGGMLGLEDYQEIKTVHWPTAEP